MPNVINQMLARELQENLGAAEGMLIVSYEGLTMSENEAFRDSLAEEGVRLRMVRNRLAVRVLAERGLEAPADLFTGNVAMAWGGPEDAIHAAKVVSKSPLKKAGKVAVRGGLLEGNLLGAQDAANLADLPSPEELKGMLVSTIAGPLRGLVGILLAPQGALVRVLQARIDKAEEGAA
ncbi:MAG: 50S ribosomal protein L10 [Planctomycetota bacterium]